MRRATDSASGSDRTDWRAASSLCRSAPSPSAPARTSVPAYTKNGSRSENVATVPSAGPQTSPIRKAPAHTPWARPRRWLGVTRTSRLTALTLNMIEPTPPAPRRTSSCQ